MLNEIDDLRGDNMNTMSTDLTKEDLQLIYLLLHAKMTIVRIKIILFQKLN